MTAVPDFQRFRAALLCGTPDRVPLAEIDVDPSIKEAWLGRPLQSPADEVEFTAADVFSPSYRGPSLGSVKVPALLGGSGHVQSLQQLLLRWFGV